MIRRIKLSKDGNVPAPKKDDKFLQVIYRSDGNVDMASNNMTVFDLWSLSSFLKMKADEMYITTQTAERMKATAHGSPIEIARVAPQEPRN